ncbi:acyl-CoA desaturase [Pseudonocardia xishanensis]|uniref:Acyl-CoA desaturase n=1 Tax=Pseudonocardia xishanensis TaxID=630995 RepID=A0ABP8RSN2_9PSEU
MAPTTGLRPRDPSRTAKPSLYTPLSRDILALGLMRRRHAYYWTRFAALLGAFAGVIAAVVWLGDTWWQLVPAAVLALVSAQFGFLGHDLAHRQVFASASWNVWSARVVSGLFTGLSYSWWMGKHSKHHNAPNQEGKDPDIGSGVLAFTPDAAAGRTGFAAWFTRRQGWAFFPLLTLEGLSLHVASVQTLWGDRSRTHRFLELAFIAVRLGGWLALLAVLVSPGIAVAAVGMQLALLGLLLGGSFAPNHKGMPLVPATVKVDFLRRQVLMSRNIRGGPMTDFMMGGLNYQIEHHLFPSMPRPNLRHAQSYVRAHCREHGVAYTETGIWQSYGIVVRYLNAVGLTERDPFRCPVVQRYHS